MAFLIRVRGKDGMWRISGLNESSTIAQVKARVEELKGVEASTQTLSSEAKGDALDDGTTLTDLGLSRGDILHIRYDGSAAPAAAAPTGPVMISGGEVVPVAAPPAAALPPVIAEPIRASGFIVVAAWPPRPMEVSKEPIP